MHWNSVHAVLFVWVSLSTCTLPGCGPAAPRDPGDPAPRPAAARPLILAHRGLTSRAPENTFAAVQAAIDLGADGVEVDVQATADGDAVIFHDPGLGRLTARSEAVQDLSLAELVRIPYRDPVTGKSTEEKIPSLNAFLNRFGGKCLLFLELKAPEGSRAGALRPRLIEKVGATILRRGLVESTLVSSLDGGLIDELERAHPEVRTVFEFFGPIAILESLPEFLPPGFPRTDWLGPHYRSITAERVRWSRDHYNGVSTFTPNLLEEFEALARQGVDLIQTDAPELALLWRSGRLRDLLARARRGPTTGWPETAPSFPGAVQRDGSLEVTIPAGDAFTVTVPATAEAINFVRFEVEHREADAGDARLMFLVLEEAEPPSNRVALTPALRGLDRGARALASHLRTIALDHGRARLSATFVAGSRTRSLCVGFGLEGGPHRLRLGRLECGAIAGE
jgi:glycerophosphoryl diester phosphodiesterase